MSAKTLSRSRGTERLAARRRRARRRLAIALAVLGVLVLAGIIWALWQPFLRIRTVTVVSEDPTVSSYAQAALQGRIFWILPRDTTFFPPKEAIRRAILAAHPEIAAVSVYHAGLDALAIRTDARTPVARWCGAAPPATGGAQPCYLFDPSGFIYATAPAYAASTTGMVATTTASSTLQTLNDFVLFAPIVGSTTAPVGGTIANGGALPAAFDFARQLSTFGSPVTSIYLHGTEADDFLASGSEVLYLLGREADAFIALTSAQGQFNLANGSISYVDARFSGKLYVKPKN